MMASLPERPRDSRPENSEMVKARLLSSRKLLVESLYHLSPLLDCVISVGLLTTDNCYEINAERTPSNKARKLLEIVDAQMDDADAFRFMDCLRSCIKHYPRLRTWLTSEDTSPLPGIQQGPTECQLQAHFSVLCSRLGCSVLPVSLDLFSSGILTQLELEKVQAVPTPTQQAQTLLSICLKKGEKACKSFYTALQDEDQQLAEELNVNSLVEELPCQSLNKEQESCSVPLAVEETKGFLRALSGLQQVMAQLGLTVGDEIRFNVCELGVAVGLPRRTVRECLFEGVGIEDSTQLEALVSLYMEKTKDAQRLLSRVTELKPQWVQLSDRGCLLLKLLQKAETLLRNGTHSHLHGWDHLHDQDHLRSWDHLHPGDCTDQHTVWAIFSFLVWDCMAEVLEEPEAKHSGGLLGMIEQLSASGRVEAALLQEVEQCWTEGNAESLLQSVRVLAQVLRDLHPRQEGLQLSYSVEGLFTCRPGRLHRVTSFQGVSARVIRKALSSMVPSLDQGATPLARQYREICVRIARLLETVREKKGTPDFSNVHITAVTQHVGFVLSELAFSSRAFDAGVRHRLQSVLEFNPAQLDLESLMEVHQETLSHLESYLQLGEHHNFQFILESVRILESAKLLSVRKVHGPFAIDNGVEEVLRFRTSEPASFLVRLHCLCYEERKGCFKVGTPRCVCMYQLKAETLREMQWLGWNVLAEAEGKVWIREGEGGGWDELQSLAQRHSVQIKDEGCCFKVKTSELECEVKFIYKSDRLWAEPHGDCEVD